jgi:hypothetical protein
LSTGLRHDSIQSMKAFQRWGLASSDLENLTPIKARDLLVQCFFEAQRETFARSSKALARDHSDDEIRKNVATMVKMTFKETGGSYDQPTKAALAKAVVALTQKAAAWGTPEDIIAHHRVQIERILTVLK